MSIPVDTILDTDPIPGFDAETLVGFKTLYLSFPLSQRLQRDEAWTATHVIDVMEGLRRKGLLVIRVAADDGSYEIILTPKGHAAARSKNRAPA